MHEGGTMFILRPITSLDRDKLITVNALCTNLTNPDFDDRPYPISMSIKIISKLLEASGYDN